MFDLGLIHGLKLCIIFTYLCSNSLKLNQKVANVVEWLKRRDYDQHSLGSKPTRAILLCPWERHFTRHPLLGGPGKQF